MAAEESGQHGVSAVIAADDGSLSVQTDEVKQAMLKQPRFRTTVLLILLAILLWIFYFVSTSDHKLAVQSNTPTTTTTITSSDSSMLHTETSMSASSIPHSNHTEPNKEWNTPNNENISFPMQLVSDYQRALQNNTVTIVITSCGRLDLLDKTTTSFFNNLRTTSTVYRIVDKFIIDDCCMFSSKIGLCLEIMQKYGDQFNVFFTKADSKYSREASIVNSLEMAQSAAAIKSNWIYHLEDDWGFMPRKADEDDVIEASLKVFESNLANYRNASFVNPNEEWLKKVHQLRDDGVYNFLYSKVACSNLHSNHARGPNGHDQLLTSNIYPQLQWWEGESHWLGYTFNAGLLLSALYRRTQPWMDYGSEQQVFVRFMKEFGLRVAEIYPPKCEHIGKRQHVSRKKIGSKRKD